jgi:hypothetical protein
MLPVIVLEKVFEPEKVFELAKSVDDAAVIVMSCEPLKAVPFIFLDVWRMVAVPALPDTEPVMVCEKVCAPVKVFAVYVLGRVVEAWIYELTKVSE